MSTDVHRQAYATCAYCPKVCRFACPVSDATHNEALSTWGKMSEAHRVTQGLTTLDASGAQGLYACTGCMRCRSYCRHENEVGFALFDARERALQARVAPPGAESTARRFSEHQNPFGRSLAAEVSRHAAASPADVPFFPGCSSLAKRPELVEDALAVGRALEVPLGVTAVSERCCGYPLYAAGDIKGFVAHAKRMASSLEPLPELVVLDPGCAYTFKVVYPRHGVEVRAPVKTVYERFAAKLEAAPKKAPLPEKVAYHDACHLGRGLGQYEEPRRLLRAAVSEVAEAPDSREEGGCSGGGGLLPRTLPESSVAIALRQAGRVAPSGETVVTACPTSRRMFERAGRKSEDVLSLVRRWLEASP